MLIWNLAVREGLFGKFEETMTMFLCQQIDIGGLGRFRDELGDGSYFEAGSCLGSWLESDWKYWTGSLSESGQGVGGLLTRQCVAVVLGCFIRPHHV